MVLTSIRLCLWVYLTSFKAEWLSRINMFKYFSEGYSI